MHLPSHIAPLAVERANAKLEGRRLGCRFATTGREKPEASGQRQRQSRFGALATQSAYSATTPTPQ